MKICKEICDNCLLFGKKLTDKSKKENNKIFYNINYYIKNKKEIKDDNIVIMKLDNNEINISDLNKKNIMKINYYLKYEDIINDEMFKNIEKNIEIISLIGIEVQLFIICNNLDEILKSFKKIKNKYDLCINFYTNFIFDTRKYKELNITNIVKQNMNNIIDKSICDNEILNKWNYLIEYKSTRSV